MVSQDPRAHQGCQELENQDYLVCQEKLGPKDHQEMMVTRDFKVSLGHVDYQGNQDHLVLQVSH